MGKRYLDLATKTGGIHFRGAATWFVMGLLVGMPVGPSPLPMWTVNAGKVICVLPLIVLAVAALQAKRRQQA